MIYVERARERLRAEPGCTCGPCAIRRGIFGLWAINASLSFYARRTGLRRVRPAGML